MEQLIKSYGQYLESISRSDMFNSEGNYNEILVEYHNKFKWYADNGNEQERIKANFLLNIM